MEKTKIEKLEMDDWIFIDCVDLQKNPLFHEVSQESLEAEFDERMGYE